MGSEAETGFGQLQEDGQDNEAEQSKILAMRQLVESREPSFDGQEVDDRTHRRFLRARDLDVEKASAMFLNHLNWRKTFVPKGVISPAEVENEIAQNKMFLQGFDKKGRPIAVLFGSRHVQIKGGLDEFKRFAVYALDKICERLPLGQEKFVVIADVEGWGYANCDIRAYLGALSILQDYYPERLGKLFIVHVPYIFKKVWKVVYPFIDRNTRNKIAFVENKKLKSTLLEDIEESQMPELYGGKLPLIPIHEHLN